MDIAGMDITGMDIAAHGPKGEWKKTPMDSKANGKRAEWTRRCKNLCFACL